MVGKEKRIRNLCIAWRSDIIKNDCRKWMFDEDGSGYISNTSVVREFDWWIYYTLSLIR